MVLDAYAGTDLSEVTRLRTRQRELAVALADLGGDVQPRAREPDVLRYQAWPARPPGPGEVRIRQTAVGVNYIDVYVRAGLYRLIEPPAPLGMEAAGVVVDTGPAVVHLLPGDRVAYACVPPGAYVSIRTMPAEHVVVLPDDVDDETAAAVMLAHDRPACLAPHASRARGRDGPAACTPRAVGFGPPVSGRRAPGARARHRLRRDSAAARDNGGPWPITSPDSRFARAVQDVTSGRGVDVIYDGLGRAAADENLQALALCGHWVSYGQATGPLTPISAEALSARSVTLSRPVIFHYTAERAALNEIAQQTFAALRGGVLRVERRHRYPLASAAEAHRDLEGRRTSGPLVLLP
jgi:NADPH:quinone reductase-like Zn-dependent oxidoreductase